MKNYNVVKQFESQIQNFADFIAITDGTQKISYKELNQKAGHTKLLEKLYQQMMIIIDETCQEILKYLQ